MKKVYLSNADVFNYAKALAHRVGDRRVIYGVPYNGVPVAYVMRQILEANLTDTPKDADLIVYAVDLHPEGKYAALIEHPEPDTRYIFPWEAQ